MWINAAETGETLYVPTSDVLYRVHGGNSSAGLEHDAQKRYIARELPYRRWLLNGVDHRGIPYGDVLRAWQAFEWHVRECEAAGLGASSELVPVEPPIATPPRSTSGAPSRRRTLRRRCDCSCERWPAIPARSRRAASCRTRSRRPHRRCPRSSSARA